MADRVVEALGAYLGPAEPDRDSGVVGSDLLIREAVEQRGSVGDGPSHFVEVAETELGERERGESSNPDHPLALSGERLPCPVGRRGPVGVEEAGEGELALELGRLAAGLIGEPGELLQQQPAAGLMASEQLVEDRREHGGLEPQLARLLWREREKLAQRVTALLDPACDPERSGALGKEPESKLEALLVFRDETERGLEPARCARRRVPDGLLAGLR